VTTIMTKNNLRVADLVAWEVDKGTPAEIAIVVDVQVPHIDDIQNEKYAKVMWNTGNISNVPLKLIYLINRSQK